MVVFIMEVTASTLLHPLPTTGQICYTDVGHVTLADESCLNTAYII